MADANGVVAKAVAASLTEDKKPIELKQTQQGSARRPTQLLPTTRIAAPKQIDLLRAFDAAAGPTRSPVGLEAVGKVAGMAANTISLATPFFTASGLLIKDGQKFLPVDAVHDYLVAHDWKPDIAAHRLAPIVRQTWYWRELETQLKYKQTMRETEVEALLAQAAEATPDYRQNIQWIVAFLDIVGLIVRDSGVVRFGPAYASNGAIDAPPVEGSAQREAAPAQDASAATPPAPTRPASSSPLATSFTQHPDGELTFHVSVRVKMSEMQGWQPDRIAALFAGVAQVLSAKADVERDAADD